MLTTTQTGNMIRGRFAEGRFKGDCRPPFGQQMDGGGGGDSGGGKQEPGLRETQEQFPVNSRLCGLVIGKGYICLQ
jgi:hypothetical protein